MFPISRERESPPPHLSSTRTSGSIALFLLLLLTLTIPCINEHHSEAEYVVAVYQYMRLLGYPANKISILTTYNGQKSLIRDIVSQRCQHSPLFGSPASISTVDQFQGQQND